MKALETVYPERQWQFWRFERSPSEYWDNPQHVERFIQNVIDQLGIAHQPSIVNDITEKQLRQLGGRALMSRCGSFSVVMKKYFSHLNPSLPTLDQTIAALPTTASSSIDSNQKEDKKNNNTNTNTNTNNNGKRNNVSEKKASKWDLFSKEDQKKSSKLQRNLYRLIQ